MLSRLSLVPKHGIHLINVLLAERGTLLLMEPRLQALLISQVNCSGDTLTCEFLRFVGSLVRLRLRLHVFGLVLLLRDVHSLGDGGSEFGPVFDGLGYLAVLVDCFFEDVSFDGSEGVFIRNVNSLDLLGLGGLHEDLLLRNVLDLVLFGY